MQVLAYVQTSRITGWKIMVLGSGTEAMAYGSRDKTRFRDLTRGDILWIIASSPGRNPSLVAKLVVDASGDKSSPEVRENPSAMELLNDKENRFPHVVTGGQGSIFFDYNDSGNALLNLPFHTSTNRSVCFRDKSPIWKSNFAQFLQRPIKIADSLKSNALEILAERCQERTVFISWKHLDHPRGRFPLQVAYALVDKGFSVWFDLLALPPSKYFVEIRQNPVVLTNLLTYGYCQSQFLLAIDSKRYGAISLEGDRNWTREEWIGVLGSNHRIKRVRVPVPVNWTSAIEEDADHTICTNIPNAIAQEFADLYSNTHH